MYASNSIWPSPKYIRNLERCNSKLEVLVEGNERQLQLVFPLIAGLLHSIALNSLLVNINCSVNFL